MVTTTEAYVDTSALIALANRADTHHALFAHLFSSPPKLISSALVVAEGHAWFLRRYGKVKALQFVSGLETMPITLVPVGREEQTESVRLLRKFQDQNLTLTDALGLHIMRTRKIKQCWSTDFHLGLTGVPLVIND